MTARRLLSLVFCAGVVLLGLEVLAVRVLSPYFGSSSFTVSSVLTVILLGLAIGYRLGGKWARRPDPERIYGWLLMLAGAGVLLVAVSQRWVLPRLGYRLPADWGPLVTALFLFALPSFALGAQSPITVQIRANLTKPEQASLSGEVAASVFFWSTLGNIVGGLVTGFLLVPRLGVSTIVAGMGCLLGALGVFVLTSLGRGRLAWMGGGALVGLALLGGRERHPHDLVDIDGVYQRIRIHDGVLNGSPARFLIQDRSVSGASYLAGDRVASDYAGVFRIGLRAKRVLILGGGAYEVPKAIFQRNAQAQIDVVEVEPALPQFAEQYFGLPRDGRLRHWITDGRRFLEETDERYGFIFCDAYSSLYSIPWHMATVEFFREVREHLEPGGIVAANLIGDTTQLDRPSPLSALVASFQAVFPEATFHPVLGAEHRGAQNVVAISGRGEWDQPAWIAHRLAAKSPGSPALRDDFAPLEHLVAVSLFR